MTTTIVARWLRRGAVSFVFLSIGLWEIFVPAYWIGYLPSFLFTSSFAASLIMAHGVALIVIGLGVLGNWMERWWAMAASALMFEVLVSVLTSTGFSDIFLRDVGIFLVALSLAVEPGTATPPASVSKN